MTAARENKGLDMATAVETCRVLVPSGMLSAGCPESAFERGLSFQPHAIAVDAGSTDSGPYYLGAGVSKSTRKAIKRDLRQLMIGRAKLNIPLLVGSCGTSGTDSGVDWLAEICLEIASEERHSLKLALLYSEQSPSQVIDYVARGAVSPLPPAPPLTADRIKECDHIVALMGFEPFERSIAQGADIVLAGRTTDTAVLAAVPLMRGLPSGPCWHAAKIAECGGLCTTIPRNGGVMLFIDAEGFEVEPLAIDNSCTPQSVSAHMLYENADPYELKEPGVLLCSGNAVYKAVDSRRVRVTGSSCIKMPYTLKLEGAGVVGYRTMVFSSIADPRVLERLDDFLKRLTNYLTTSIGRVLGYAGDYALQLRPYGAGVLRAPGDVQTYPDASEIGLMVIISAKTQAVATEIAKFCNPILLHFPLEPDDALPSFAFPFSPAEVELGRHFEFKLNHVVAIDDPQELVRVRFFSVHNGERHAAA